VTGHDDGHAIHPVRAADGALGAGRLQQPREPGVRAGLAVGDPNELPPDALLERRARSFIFSMEPGTSRQ
jgi:hypothetical protein